MNKVYLFFGVCIPVRLFLVFLTAFIIHLDNMKYMAIPLFIMSGGFILAQLFRTAAIESSGTGGKVWWHNIRPVHIILYLTAAFLAIYEPKDTWIPLLVDVIFGVIHLMILL